MFNNLGKKIQTCARVFAIIGIGISIIYGIIFWANAIRFEIDLYYLYGILVFGGGALFSWLNSIMIYGFGIIVESHEKKLSEINDNGVKGKEEQKKGVKPCDYCGAKLELDATICPECGNKVVEETIDYDLLEKTLTPEEFDIVKNILSK